MSEADTGRRSMLGMVRGNSRVASIARVIALRAMAIGVNVCTGLLTAAVLGPTGRGEQTAMTVAPNFLAAIGTLGLHASYIYNSKAEPDLEREYLGTNLILTTLAGLTIAAVGWVGLPYWLHDYSPATIFLARMFLCTTPFTVVTYSFQAAAEGRGWFGFANGTLYLQSMSVLVILAVLALTHHLTPATASFAYMFPTFPAFFYFGWHVVKRIKPRFPTRGYFSGRLLRYGLRFYGIDILGTAASYLDQIMIVALLDAKLVGIYTVAMSLARMLNILQTAITSVLFPSIAARDSKEVLETVAATLRVAVVFTASVALAVGIVGPYAIHLLYGARFAAAVAPFRLLLVDAVIASSARILYQAYSGSGRPEWVSGFEGAGVACSFVAMLVLVPYLGLPGAALGMIAGSAVRMVCALGGLRVILKMRIPRLILHPSDIRDGLRLRSMPTDIMPNESI